MHPNKQSTHAHFLILSILIKQKIDKDLTLLRFGSIEEIAFTQRQRELNSKSAVSVSEVH